MSFKKLPVQWPEIPIRKFQTFEKAYALIRDIVQALGRFRIMVASSFNDLQINETWTPVLEGSSTAGTQTYDTNGQVGTYLRIGDLVFAQFRIRLTNFDGATSGNIVITGLPIAAKTITGFTFAGSTGQYSSINLNAAGGYSQLILIVTNGASEIRLQECGDNVAVANITEADIANTSLISGVAIYEAAT